MKFLLSAAITSAFFLLGATEAQALYNGSAGTNPQAQGWSRPTPDGVESTDAAGTTLNTNGSGSDFNIRDGYAISPTLNRNTGFNLRFDLQLLSEARSSTASNNTAIDNIDDRAGLSITVLSSDRQGIELGFWLDQIWAQDDGAVKADPTVQANPPSGPAGTRFTHVLTESTSFNTASSVTQYDLSIVGNRYFFYANRNYGSPLLTGRLRNYSPEAAFGGAAAVYALPNFVFIGDNTTSAQGSFRLNQVQLSSAITPVPFAFNPLFGLGLFGLSRLRKVLRKSID